MATEIYADGADLQKMTALSVHPQVSGFTTNPSLARKAGVPGNYRTFCVKALAAAGGKPVSLEVLADDLTGMLGQAELLAGLGSNAVVKIPVMTTKGESTEPVISALARTKVPVNVTAVFTKAQVKHVARALAFGGRTYKPIVSVFAGRIADTGTDPVAHMLECRIILRRAFPSARMLWASPRQSYDLSFAERVNCDIITMTPDLIDKLALRGKSLEEYSRETVEMFYRDAQEAGFEL